MPYIECYYVKIRANNYEECQNKFIQYLIKNGENIKSIDKNNMYIININELETYEG